MFRSELDHNGTKTITSGGIISGDKVWYTNDSLQQTLVFELYTDDYRADIFHFDNRDIPPGLIDQMELHVTGGELATSRQKQKDFKGFLSQATKISTSYFTSSKGFRLSDKKQKAIAAYGRPDSDKTINGIETLSWRFTGDTFYSDTTDLKGKPAAKDSYDYEVTMYFRDNKLIAQAIHNDIP